MTEQLLHWLWDLSSRDLSALIGIGFIALAGVTWVVQIPGKITASLDRIADAIKGSK